MTVQNLKLRAPINFPASVMGIGGIKVSKANGAFTIQPDFSAIASADPDSITDPSTKQIWIYDNVTGEYNVLSLIGFRNALSQLTSETSLPIQTGSAVFTDVEVNRDISIGSWMIATSDANPTTNYMVGQVTAYSGSSLTLDVTVASGSGTHADWTIRVSGAIPSGVMLGGNNLSDLSDAATARTNLGLGGAAILNVGTATGTVAAGNDSRLNSVRFDAAQSLTSAQRKQAFDNLKLAHAIPENYGENVGSGDPYTGGNDDAVAIQACLDANGVCYLDGRKTYWLSSQVSMGPLNRIVGLGKTSVYFTTNPALQYTGFVMFAMAGNCELHNLSLHCVGAFCGVAITHGGSQVIKNVDISNAYSACLYITAAELITNGTFDTDASGWTLVNGAGSNTVAWSSANGGTLVWNNDGAHTAYASQTVSTSVGTTYVVYVDEVTGTGVRLDVGTTAFGNDVLADKLLDSGLNFQGVTGRSFFSFVATATTTYITFKRAAAGTASIDNVHVQESGVGTALVYDTGTLFTKAQDGTVGKYAAIFLPIYELTVVGLRRFENLNGAGTVLFDLQGSNLTQMINCYQDGIGYQFATWTMSATATYPRISGGRFAAPMDIRSSNYSIDGCTIGALITIYPGASGVISDTNRLSNGITLTSNSSGNTIHWRPNMGVLTDQSNGANTILGLPPGGTVTQATSKSTGVTLNTRSGQITMNAAALAASTAVSFTVANNTITTQDVVLACHSSAGTAGSYAVEANAIAAGSFRLTVRNVSGASLSEAIVISFVATRGSVS